MKYLGLLCMAAAAVAGGFLLAGEWEMRVKMLGIFRQMAVYLKARILYSLSLIHISEPTRLTALSRMPSSA